MRVRATPPVQREHGLPVVDAAGSRQEVTATSGGSDTSLAQRIRKAIATGGHPLEDRAQRRLKQGLGVPFSAVRVHTDANASTLAHSLHALAFTTGNNIFFRSGMYRPDTRQGMSLLAHEATHTLQQAAGPVAGSLSPGGLTISHPGDPFERAASSTAVRFGAGFAAPAHLEATSLRAGASPTGTGPLPIQRAVGFEVELNIPVSHYNPANGDAIDPQHRPQANDWANARVGVPYKKIPHSLKFIKEEPSTIYKAANLSVVPDIGNDFVSKQKIEIVTTPIATTDAAAIDTDVTVLQTQMQTLYDFIQQRNPRNARFLLPGGPGAEQQAMIGIPTTADPTNSFTQADRNKVSWSGNLQATAGIYTHKLVAAHTALAKGSAGGIHPAYYDVLQSPKVRNRGIAEQAIGIADTVYNQVNASSLRKFKPDDPNAEAALKGVLTLVAAYLLGGRMDNVESTNPKNITGVFSRSAFSAVRAFGLSTNGASWVYGNGPKLAVAFAEATKRKPNEPLYNHPQGLENNTTTVEAFLREAFQNPHGRDTFTENESKNLIGPENLGGPNPRPGAVLEFRQISGAGDTPNAWATRMKAVAQAIRQLNT